MDKNFGAYIVDDLVLDTLETLGPNAQIKPNLATSVTQENPVTYVYHLRHDAKFWNGDPLTSADVIYSLNYVRSAGSEAAFIFPPVKSITADVPYVPLYLTDYTVALSPRFTNSNFSYCLDNDNNYALGIKAAS